MIINQIAKVQPGYKNNDIKKLLDRTIESMNLPDGLIETGRYTFYDCIYLVNVNFNSELKTIGTYSFSGCSNLKFNNLPVNIEELALGCFRDCTDLENVTLNGVKTISNSSFDGCSGLISVNMPKVSTIGGTTATTGSFRNCTSLTTVRIGKDITSIGRYTFRGCSNINKIYIDKPRSEVEAMSNFQYAWSSESTTEQTLSTSVIVCNDDYDWI